MKSEAEDRLETPSDFHISTAVHKKKKKQKEKGDYYY